MITAKHLEHSLLDHGDVACWVDGQVAGALVLALERVYLV